MSQDKIIPIIEHGKHSDLCVEFYLGRRSLDAWRMNRKICKIHLDSKKLIEIGEGGAEYWEIAQCVDLARNLFEAYFNAKETFEVNFKVQQNAKVIEEHSSDQG